MAMDMAFNFWLRRADQNSSPFLGARILWLSLVVERLGFTVGV